VPENGKNAESWSSPDKFAVILETAPLNEAELAEYCRRKGLFAEQILIWEQMRFEGKRGSMALDSDRRYAVALVKEAAASGGGDL